MNHIFSLAHELINFAPTFQKKTIIKTSHTQVRKLFFFPNYFFQPFSNLGFSLNSLFS
jgi:hypothetical protein